MSSRKDSKTVWLEEGLKILETKGPGMLSIESLTIRTGKTKGSFYHHFNSREKYIANLLEYYDKITIRDVIQIANLEQDPRASIKRLTKLAFQLSSDLELAIRAWALYDPMVKDFQDRLDRQRLKHLKKLYMASGMKADKARTQSYRNYSLFIGLQQLKQHHTKNEFRKLLKDIFTNKV